MKKDGIVAAASRRAKVAGLEHAFDFFGVRYLGTWIVANSPP